ncbi:MAG TPA: aminotransferase class V-fold PLP-dependent enzyme [Bacteroidales bacterium]|nr:aminotransferase class V-fold PLP-dependent enzyme [Bacteroidales bacterium]
MKKKDVNSSRVPVYRDAGFELFNADITSQAFENEKNPRHDPDFYIYSRYRNPTVVSAEQEIMKLEECNWAFLTQSGMSAIETSLSVFHKGKSTPPMLFFTEIYGGTISFIDTVLASRRGVDVRYFTPENGRYDYEALEKMIAEIKPGVVYIETISNPMLIVSDIRKVIKIASKYGSKVIVDNTFATPLLYRPLEDGADIVIHSATKYLSGHGNITAGVICGNDENIRKEIIEYRKLVGHMISPDDAYRLQTQMESFSLRFMKQCSNAANLAAFLSNSVMISEVWYPGLPGHTTHDLAADLFSKKGYGAMITFDIKGIDRNEKRSRRDSFIKMVSEKIKLIPSLGDSRTILMPVEAVWGVKYPEPGMIRLSVGFEDYGQIESTISCALKAL